MPRSRCVVASFAFESTTNTTAGVPGERVANLIAAGWTTPSKTFHSFRSPRTRAPSTQVHVSAAGAESLVKGTDRLSLSQLCHTADPRTCVQARALVIVNELTGP
jgi:hypothetical protein